jgi:hypothetical protein
MKRNISQDEKSWTHIDWELGEVTARMLDWFWCNMEKGDYLWHPNQHNNFEWMPGYGVKDLGTPIGSIHIAPQTWNDGKVMRPYLRIEPLSAVPKKYGILLSMTMSLL